MKRDTMTWAGPLVLATVVLIVSAYLRFAPSPSSADTDGITTVVGEAVEKPSQTTDQPLPETLPATGHLTEWTRTSGGINPSWSLRWESDAIRAARVLSYLSTHSQVTEFSLTAGTGSEWIVEASIRGSSDERDTSPVAFTDSHAEAELQRLLQASGTGTSDNGDSLPSGTGVVHAILNGGTGSVRFRSGDTYGWVRHDEVLSLELSP